MIQLCRSSLLFYINLWAQDSHSSFIMWTQLHMGSVGFTFLLKVLLLPTLNEQPFLVRVQFSSVQSLSHVQLFATQWIPARQAALSNTNSRSSLRLASIESVMPSSHLVLCQPLLLLPSVLQNSLTVMCRLMLDRLTLRRYMCAVSGWFLPTIFSCH